MATSGGVAWKISVVAQPTNLAVTEGRPGEPADRYVLVLTNTGGVESDGTIELTDTLPVHVAIGGGLVGAGWECSAGQGAFVVDCVYHGKVPPLGQSPVLTIPVTVAAQDARLELVSGVMVSGGGAPVAKMNVSTKVDAGAPPFEFLDFASQTTDTLGLPDTQAGDHPNAFSTGLDFPQREVEENPGVAVQLPKDVEIDLPTGLVGDPRAVSSCKIVDLFARHCPPSSRIGTFFLNFAEGIFREEHSAYPIYNLVPERGYPAEFGLFAEAVNRPALLYASVGPPPDYRLHVSMPDVPTAAGLTSVIVTFFGDPQRMDGGANSSTAFFTNPSDCSGAPLATSIKVETWEEQGKWVPDTAEAAPVAGCNLLRFEPSISLTPETTLADEPSGYTVEAKFPQAPTDPEALANPPVKNTTVTLPPGLSLNPAAADGLVACSAEGPEGFNLSQSGSGHCPLASQVGTVEATTPLLSEPVQGHVYVAAPGCGGVGQEPCREADALDGNLYGLYVQLEGSGIVVKLHGTASANPATGQLTASFRETPQLPVSDLKFVLKGGPRAPLANPQSCGEALTQADMTPWSSPETPEATPSFAFPVTGCGGSFTPSFTSGTTGTAGGAYTEFSTTIGRTDRMQDLGAIQVRTPPGLLGMLSHVTLCREPQAALGTCSAASEIGTAAASAGAGSHPFWVSGKVYVTGPYKGAPFGLSIVLPAKAGPFNLGTVVTRAALNANQNTAALTVTSDPLPQILDGTPLRVQTVTVTINRPQFMFNPTHCSAQQVTGTIASAAGTTAQVSAPFAAGGCKNLPFNPGFTVATRKPAAKLDGAELDVKVASTAGQANIRSVAVALPKQLPSRLKTIQQACRDTTFDANPAACPAVSQIGVAKAVSPVLPAALVGPAYLVSHGGAAFPDLDIVLQGEGVRLDLTGSINISRKGITSSTFASIPDAPISTFELQLPEGPHSVLTTNGSLCGKTLTMPTTIVGQNGRRLIRTTKIAAARCPKAKKAKSSGRAGKARLVGLARATKGSR